MRRNPVTCKYIGFVNQNPATIIVGYVNQTPATTIVGYVYCLS